MKIDEIKTAYRCEGNAGFPTPLTDGGLNHTPLIGDFTIEAWVRLDPPERGVTLYNEVNYGGPGVVLAAGRYDDLSKRLPAGQVTLYTEAHGQGASRKFEAGSTFDLLAEGMASIGSVEVPPWLTLTLFDQEGGKGQSISYRDDSSDTGDWKTKVKSAAVFRTLQSLRIPRGWEVMLFDQPRCEGQACRLTENMEKADSSKLGIITLDKVGSIAILDLTHAKQSMAVFHVEKNFGTGRVSCLSLGGQAALGKPHSLRTDPVAPSKFTLFDQLGRQGKSFVWDGVHPEVLSDNSPGFPLAEIASVDAPGGTVFLASPSTDGRTSVAVFTGPQDSIAFGTTWGSINLPPGLQAMLYPEANFHGKPLICEGPVSDLGGYVAKSVMLCRVPPPPVERIPLMHIFSKPSFENEEGGGTTTEFVAWNEWSSFCPADIRSFRMPAGYRMMLFGNNDWSGEPIEVDGNRSHLDLKVGEFHPYPSIIISNVFGEGRTAARTFHKPLSAGWGTDLTDLPVGKYPDIALFKANRIKIMPGCQARLYPQPNFSGEVRELLPGETDLPDQGSLEIVRREVIFGSPTCGLYLTVEVPASEVAPPLVTFGGERLVRNQWHRLAVARKDRQWTWYLNGKKIKEVAWGGADDPLDSCVVGDYFTGLIGPIVVQKGAVDPGQMLFNDFNVPEKPASNDQLAVFGLNVDQLAPSVKFAQVRYPRPVAATALAQGVTARTEAHNLVRIRDAKSEAAERKRKAETKAMLFTQDAHNGAAALAAAAQLRAVWRAEKGQLANEGGNVISQPLSLPAANDAFTVTAVDSDEETVYLARWKIESAESPCGEIVSYKMDGSNTPQKICDIKSAIHALALHTTEKNIFWIEHPGELHRCATAPNSTPVKVTDLPVGSDDMWSLCVENQQTPPKSWLYWSNGREIWRADLKEGNLSNRRLLVSHGQSLRPVALAVDESFDSTKDIYRGKLFWADRDLAQIRCLTGSGNIHNLYSAPCPREALGIDPVLQRIYWNAEHRPLMETAIIERAGLFYWFEDRGESLPRHQNLEVVEDLREYNIKFDADSGEPTLEKTAPDTWAKVPAKEARRSLLFNPNGADCANVDKGAYIALGPIYLDCTHGFAAETVVRFDNLTKNARIFDLGNGRANLNVFLALDPNNKLMFQVYNRGDADGTGRYLTSSSVIEAKKWYHIIATIDAAGQGVIYLNGQPVADGKIGVPAAGARCTNWIGRSNWPADSLLDGRIAMLRLWNLGLDAAAVATSWKNPFLAFSSADNPLGQFDEHLVPYHRSMIEHRDGRVWLMSGVLDGAWPAVPLFEMAADSNLALQSTAKAQHEALIKAHYDRSQADAKRSADVISAKKIAQSQLSQAHDDAARMHLEADQKIATAKADADTKRKDAHERQRAETDKQNQHVAAQKATGETSIAQAQSEANQIEKAARERKANRINDANRRLAEANAERAKR